MFIANVTLQKLHVWFYVMFLDILTYYWQRLSWDLRKVTIQNLYISLTFILIPSRVKTVYSREFSIRNSIQLHYVS